MRLNRKSEIAIGILALCASAPEETICIQHLADQTGTTRGHAARIVTLLVRSGLLVSIRGRGGGVGLAARAASKPLAQVIELTQPDLVGGKDGEVPMQTSGTEALDMIVKASSNFVLQLIKNFTIGELVVENKTRQTVNLKHS